jgi:hypothetical protein
MRKARRSSVNYNVQIKLRSTAITVPSPMCHDTVAFYAENNYGLNSPENAENVQNM